MGNLEVQRKKTNASQPPQISKVKLEHVMPNKPVVIDFKCQNFAKQAQENFENQVAREAEYYSINKAPDGTIKQYGLPLKNDGTDYKSLALAVLDVKSGKIKQNPADTFTIDFSKPKSAYQYKAYDNGDVEIKLGDTTLFGRNDSGTVGYEKMLRCDDNVIVWKGHLDASGLKPLYEYGELYLDNQAKNIKIDGGKSVDSYTMGDCKNINIKDNKSSRIYGNTFGWVDDTKPENVKLILNGRNETKELYDWINLTNKNK